MAPNSHHEQLATTLADDYKRALLSSMHRIGQAASRGLAVSFSATAQFHEDKAGDLVVDFKPRERIPLEPTTHKLTRQMGLFEGSDSEDE